MHGEDRHENDGQPKAGDGQPERCKGTGAAVDRTLRPDTREQAHWDPTTSATMAEHHHETEGDGEPLLDLLGHRLAG